jgi:phospholipase/carboxylesterase
MAHGTDDEIIPCRFAEMTVEALHKQGYSALGWHTYAMGHSLCPEEVGDIRRWLLKGFNVP